MSFLIAIYVSEGIVLATDRRTTYSNTKTVDGNVLQQIGVFNTNSTDKTFLCPNGAGISACGEGAVFGKPIAFFIKDMIKNNIYESTSVESMPEIVIDYFSSLSVVPDADFIIAGYEKTNLGKKQALYKLNVKSKKIEKRNTDVQGANWHGEVATLTRLVQQVAIKTDSAEYVDLPFQEIMWSCFTLQDAVDFARYAVDTTIKTMHFKNAVETVGGATDILLITPDKSEWIQKEELK